MGPTNRTPVRGAARLAAILDALPDALVLVDGSGAIVNANSAALGLFEGESAERLLGKPIAEILPGLGRTVATPGSGPAALPAGSSGLDPRDLVGGAGGSVRRPPERMAARRTDGSIFPAEVTTAELTEEDESELTLLVVRDLTGVLDVEAELRRQQRQIELILRAASEGIIGVDHEGRIVLVNPAGAKILRYRAAELGGQNVHELLTHSRPDGTPLPESECPLLDSVRTGAKHRAVDCVLWRSDGGPVYVDLTTAPVYEGENIIGAVMTFVDNSATRAAARQAAELTNVLDKDLRGALVEVALRLREVVDYTEAEYAAGGYGSSTLPMLEEVGEDLDQLTELAADVVDFQQSVLGTLEYQPETTELIGVVDAAVSAAAPAAGAAGVEIAAHCADVEVDLDVDLFVKLLAHLLADMVSVSPVGGKIVVTAARRGTLARIEIRGPHTGGGPLHLPIAQAIAAKHGGTVTTHRIAGKGNTHVVEVPVTQPNMPERPTAPKPVEGPVRPALPTRVRAPGARTNPIAAARLGASPAQNPSPAATSSPNTGAPGPAAPSASATTATATNEAEPEVVEPEQAAVEAEAPQVNGQYAASRRRRAAASSPELQARIPAQSRSSLGRSVGSIADLRPSRPMPTGDVWSKPDRGVTGEPAPTQPDQGSEFAAEPTVELGAEAPAPTAPDTQAPGAAEPVRYAQPWQLGESRPEQQPQSYPQTQSQSYPQPQPEPQPQPQPQPQPELVQPVQASQNPPLWQLAEPEPEPEPEPVAPVAEPAPPLVEQMQPPAYVAAQPRGRRRAAQQQQPEQAEQQNASAPAVREAQQPEAAEAPAAEPVRYQLQPVAQPLQPNTYQPVQPNQQSEPPVGYGLPGRGQPQPAGYTVPGRGQSAAPAGYAQPQPESEQPEQPAAAPEPTTYALTARVSPALPPAAAPSQPEPEPESGPEHDGPRLLLWPDPDEETHQLLRERGYDPVAVGQPNRIPTLTANGTGEPHPFAVFVDPISAPITRRGLREVRAAATKAGLPLLVTAGIGHAPDGRDLGPDPSLLLTALCPAEVRLPRVLLVEARADLADAIADILERQGMQVTQATTDAESREAAVAAPPDLVLLDLMQIRRRRVGVVDWLRDRGLLARTPLVVYTAEGSDAGALDDTLYLTERATDAEPAGRLGDLLAKIAP